MAAKDLESFIKCLANEPLETSQQNGLFRMEGAALGANSGKGQRLENSPNALDWVLLVMEFGNASLYYFTYVGDTMTFWWTLTRLNWLRELFSRSLGSCAVWSAYYS